MGNSRWASRWLGWILVAFLAVLSAPPALAQSSISYTYDTLGRVSSVTYPSGTTITYTYDAAGNRTQEVVSCVTCPLTANNVSLNVPYNSTNNAVPLNITGGTATSVAVSTGAGHGTATASGISITYTPTSGYSGSDSFQYKATNTAGTSAAGTVSLTVIPPPPVANAVSASVDYNSTNNPITLNITGGTPTSVAVSTQASHGTASASGTSITYTPTSGYSGSDSFAYTASNAGGISAPATATLSVAQALAITTTSLPSAEQGVAYSQTIGTSGGVSPITFSVSSGTLPAGLSLAASTGVLSGTPSASGSSSFTVKATDADGGTASQVYTLTVANGLGISTTTLPEPEVSRSYSQTIATVGGVAPITFSVSAGSLPAGLSLAASTGVISGTPTTSGSLSFTIKAVDSDSHSATEAYSGSVAAALAITTTSLTPPEVGSSFSQTIATSGGVTPLTFSVSAGSLPAGLSLNTAAGAITGTPTTSGSYSFTLKATDADGAAPTEGYSGSVDAALAISTTSLAAMEVGSSYSQTVATSGGVPSITFSVSAGSLPAGLSLAASTGAISGTPTTSGSYSFTIKATDADSVSATKAYSGSVAATLAISTTTLPAPALGVSYNETIATTGGVSPIAFSVSAGSLPAGLSLAGSTGVISGTPTATGSYSFTIKAADADSKSASQAYSGTIVALPVANNVSATVAENSSGNSITLSLTGGAASSVAVSTQASHGTATASGTSITYTPTSNYYGADSFSYTATNAAGTSAAATASITVSATSGTVLYTSSTAGSFSYTIPAGVSYVDIEGWGSGSSASYLGDVCVMGVCTYIYSPGSGGAYFKKNISVTAGQVITGVVDSANDGKATTVSSPSLSAGSALLDEGGAATGGDTNTSGTAGTASYGGGAGNGGGNQTTANGNGTVPGGGGAENTGVGQNGQIKITARSS